jgi:hypothetical protein
VAFVWSSAVRFDEKLRSEIINMTSRLAISYLIFSQYSKIPVTYQISLLGQKAPANKSVWLANGLIFFTRNMLLDRKWGGGGGGKYTKKAE